MKLNLNFPTLLGASALLLVVACDNDPAEGKTKVQATEAVEVKEEAPAASSTVVVLPVSEKNGSVGFVGAKITDKHEGTFEKFQGNIRLVDGDIEKSEVSVNIDINSLEIEPAKLKGHLMTPDFFDPEKFPEATFVSTSIKSGGTDGATHTVTGNLQLHGVTKSITFPAKLTTNDASATVDAEFAINRKDFGIVYPGMPDDLIKDDVLIKLQLKADK